MGRSKTGYMALRKIVLGLIAAEVVALHVWAIPLYPLGRGLAAYQQKDYPRAARWCRLAVVLAPRSGNAHALLACSLAEEGIRNQDRLLDRLGEAVAEARRAVEVQPEAAGHRTAWGDFLFLEGDRDGAVTQYRAALRFCPWDATAATHLAYALSVLGRHEEALDALRNLWKREPNLRRAAQVADTSLRALKREGEAAALEHTVGMLCPEEAEVGKALQRESAISMPCYRGLGPRL